MSRGTVITTVPVADGVHIQYTPIVGRQKRWCGTRQKPEPGGPEFPDAGNQDLRILCQQRHFAQSMLA
jgi:hypothetical protein